MTQLSNVRVTDEQLAVWKAEAKRVMHHPATPMDIHCHAYATYVLATELQERRSAEAERKPVRYLNKFTGVCVTLEQQPDAATDTAVYVPLYAAPQPVAVPDELAGKSFEYIANKFQVSISDAQWILVGWNACRAAMLKGDKS